MPFPYSFRLTVPSPVPDDSPGAALAAAAARLAAVGAVVVRPRRNAPGFRFAPRWEVGRRTWLGAVSDSVVTADRAADGRVVLTAAVSCELPLVFATLTASAVGAVAGVAGVAVAVGAWAAVAVGNYALTRALSRRASAVRRAPGRRPPGVASQATRCPV